MPDQPANEKTEPATAKKRREVREKGQVFYSQEVNSVAALLAGVVILRIAGRNMLLKLMAASHYVVSLLDRKEITADSACLLFREFIEIVLRLMTPILVGILVVGIAVCVAQVGFLVSFQSIMPKLSKIKPNFKAINFFSSERIMDLVVSLSKCVLMAGIGVSVVRKRIFEFLSLLDKEPVQIFFFIANITFEIFLKIAIALIVIAIIDFVYKKWKFEKDIMMTKQEVKEEYKQMEGDPHVRSRIRSIQRRFALQRMMKQVPESDVVVTNPFHLAVAIKYKAGMEAPVVVAKGARKIAVKIKEVAVDSDIPIVENKELARALFKRCEVNDTVPFELYQAVAEVLVYIYRLKGRRVA